MTPDPYRSPLYAHHHARSIADYHHEEDITKGLNLPPISVDLASAISLLAVKLLLPCSGEPGWKEQSSTAKHGPGEKQLFCWSRRRRFLTGLENNKFSIKPASSSGLGALCRGGSGSSCMAR